MAFLMRAAGLVTAVNLLLVHPDHATSLQLLLSGLLLLGGQAAKDLLLGLVDRLLAPPHHPQSEPEPPAPVELEAQRRKRGR